MNENTTKWHDGRLLAAANVDFISSEIANFRPTGKFCFVTFTLKQGLGNKPVESEKYSVLDSSIYNKRKSSLVDVEARKLKSPRLTNLVFQPLTRQIASNALGKFMRSLNRKIFKNASRRFEKRLICVPSFETSLDGRLHIHMVLEIPEYMSFEEFRRYVDCIWKNNPWARPIYDIVEITSKSEELRITKYILKDLWKDLDGLDVENLHLGRSIH